MILSQYLKKRDLMRWKIEFYSDKVEQNILEWPKGVLINFLSITNALEEVGPIELGMPYIKSLKQGLFEIRAHGKEGIGRALFCMVKGKIVIILNGFIKKTQKAPTNEVKLARKRLQEMQEK